MEAKKIELKPLLFSLCTIAAIEWVGRGLVSRNLGHPMEVLGAMRLLEIIAIVLIVLLWGKGLLSIGLGRPEFLPGLKRGLIWSAGFGIVALVAYVLLRLVGINGLALMRVHLPEKPGALILFLFVGGLVGPVAEEVFFRGILYGFFRRWGRWIALVLTTLLFVLVHPVFPGIPVTQVVGGIVFALAYEIEAKLMAPITIHVLGNLAIFSLSITV